MQKVVGPYLLGEQLGRGGMGVVYRATHSDTGIPVALKMMRVEPGKTRHQSVFLNELHQAAKLDHPNIATIFDYGETTAEDSERSGGEVLADQPYIAMEIAHRGSLDHLDDILSWHDLYGIMRALLQGLGHAHARGILHRDIKPGNVLLGSPEDLRPSIKIADFGLALTQNQGISPETALRVVGTPEYMAPEQIEGLWRDQGPWTDLYALGCVAYELASGWTPFGGDSPRQIALAHLSTPVPPLRAMTVLPEGFEAWLLRMLSKEPSARFQSAADAAYALSLVETETCGSTPIPGPQRKESASPTWTFMDFDLPEAPRRPANAGPAIHPEDAPPPVTDWRGLADTSAPFPLTGATLNLVGIKHQRMVGRTAERDQLWRNLTEVVQTTYPRAVVIRGTAGIGKGRLVQWLQETAHETGMATCLKATHGELRGPSHGLGSMFAHFLHTRGLSGPRVIERTNEVLRQHGIDDGFDRDALGRAVLPASGAVSQPDTVPVGSHTEQLALFERILSGLTEHRPMILHLEDAQWGDVALQLARRLLAERAKPLPVLVVITVDEDHLLQRTHEHQHLRQIEESPRAETITLGPLADEDLRTLMESVLRVESRLGREIRARSAGSPVFAIQMVEDLVERGLVEASHKGFQLKPDVSLTLPSSIEALWSDRLTACMSGLGDGALGAIQVGAALGEVVEQTDWMSVCGTLGIEIPAPLLPRMTRAGLIETHPTNWRFSHGLLARSIAASAGEHWRPINRACAQMLMEQPPAPGLSARIGQHLIAASAGEHWRPINRACAQMLMEQPPAPGLSARIGQHLIAAGRQEEALSYLLRGAKECWHSADLYEALNLLDAHEAAMTTLGLPQSDARWGMQWIERVLVDHALQRFDVALPIAVKMCEAAIAYNWTVLKARAFRMRGMIATEHNEFADADEQFARAASFVTAGQEREQAAINRHWGWMLRRMGKGQAALDRLELAADTFRRENELRDLAYTLFNQASVQLTLLSNVDLALELLQEAEALFRSRQDRLGLAHCLNGIAEIHRSNKNLDEAEAAYDEAALAFRRAGVDTAVVPMANRSLLCLEREQYDSAERLLAELQQTIKTGAWSALMPFVSAGLLVVAGARRDWPAWEETEAKLRASLSETPMVERDLAIPLEHAGMVAAREGRSDLACQVLKMALDQWRALADDDGMKRVEERLFKLGS